MLAMVISEAPCDVAKLLAVPFHPHDCGLDALQQLLILLQEGRQQDGVMQGVLGCPSGTDLRY